MGERHGAELRGSHQALELDGHIRKGEKGSLVVYADSIKRKETDQKTGYEIDREIPFLKGRAGPRRAPLLCAAMAISVFTVSCSCGAVR
jgi:hypothetical protein